MQKSRAILDGLIRPLREFLFPPLCFVCERLLSECEEQICGSCLSSIRPVRSTDPHYQETLVRLISEETISGLVAAYYFEAGGTLQSIVHQLKYNGMTSLGKFLGRRLGERVKRDLAGEKISALVPVPLHISKRRERGYNQCEFICRGMATVLALPVEPKWLARRVYTRSQTKLSIEERKQNVAEAFGVSGGGSLMLKDATVLLVDDVVTTGATMQACARVLRDAGVERVIACAAALAL